MVYRDTFLRYTHKYGQHQFSLTCITYIFGNLPFTDLLEAGVLKSKKDLAKAFYMVAEQDDPLIFSCGSGITACVLALGAELSGYKNISVYDGSWTEYGSLTTGDMENPC